MGQRIPSRTIVIKLYIMLSNGFSKLLRKPLAACLSASPKTKPAQKEDQCYERNSRISMKERARPVCGIDDSGRVSSRFLIDRLPKISQNTWFVWVRFLLSRFPNLTVQERPGRYVPLESTWWGFRMFQTLPGFLWYPLIVWLRMNGMPMNQQFLGHLSCRLHVDLVDLMPEITGCTMSACRVPVKCCSVLPWYVGHDQTKAPGSMPGSMPGCTISAESTAALAARMDMTSMGVTNLTHFGGYKSYTFSETQSFAFWFWSFWFELKNLMSFVHILLTASDPNREDHIVHSRKTWSWPVSGIHMYPPSCCM